MRHRESAAGLLVAGLAEVRLEFRRVGHRESRAVLEQNPMATPTRHAVRGVEASPKRVDQPPKERHRQPLARLTIRRRGEPLAGQMRQVRHRGVLVQDLEKEQMQRRVGIEPAIAPGVVQVPAHLLHRRSVQLLRQVFPDLPQLG